jgi:hypothetical protein
MAHRPRSGRKIQTVAVLFLVLLTLSGASKRSFGGSGTWSTTGSLITPRDGHTAALLANGTVLITGGETQLGSNIYVTTAERYDPAAGTWALAGNDVCGGPGVLLPDGKLLLQCRYNSYSLFDPATGISRSTTDSANSHANPPVLLPAGKILVAGSCTWGLFSSRTELYDYASETWQATGDPLGGVGVGGAPNGTVMWIYFLHNTATVLSDGRMLIAGGLSYPGGRYLTSSFCQLYDSITGLWSETGTLNTARQRHTATLLHDGRVLVAGGGLRVQSGTTTELVYSTCELYNPATGAWTSTGSMASPRMDHTATLLRDGRVLVAGGVSAWFSSNYLASAEIYDPTTETWSSAGNMSQPRSLHSATPLGDGKVLIAGGTSATGSLAGVEIYAPDYTTCTTIATHPGSTTIPYNSAVTLRVVASGTGLSYQWYTGTTGDTSAPIPGANSSSYTTPSLTANAFYWVRVTGSCDNPADSRTARVTVLPCYDQTFESGNGGWTTTGLWHLSTACGAAQAGHSQPTALYFGVDSQCNYSTGGKVAGALTSPVIDLTRSTGTLTLNFKYRLKTEALLHYDKAVFEIWDGSAWMQKDSDTSNGGSLIIDGTWREATYDLSLYAGQKIALRFSFDSIDGNSNAFEGWFIDDVKVTGTCQLCRTSTDFNGDGQTDILWRHAATGQNIAWSMSGTDFAAFTWINPAIPDAAWQIVGQGDFNNDGKTDILWRHDIAGLNVVWYMNGTTFLSCEYVYPTIPDPSWKIAGVEDFNGDNQSDILWWNTATGGVIVWLMNGSNLVSWQWIAESATDLNWKIVGVGDFNVDGKPDILWRNAAGGENLVWFMNGVSMQGSAAITAESDANWKIVGVRDFNGDGNADILWRHAVSGSTRIWVMSGTDVVSTRQVTPTIEDANWKIVGPK